MKQILKYHTQYFEDKLLHIRFEITFCSEMNVTYTGIPTRYIYEYEYNLLNNKISLDF